MRGGHTNCANTWFQRFTKRQTPLLPHFCVWWEIVGEGKWGKTAPGTITSVRGATDWFVPFFVQSLFFFCDIFMLERKHNRATRETGHGKTGYFHGNDNEEKATSYPLGDSEKSVKIFSLLVRLSCCCPYYSLFLSALLFVGTLIFRRMNIQFLLQAFLCALLGVGQCRTKRWFFKASQPIVSLHNLFTVPLYTYIHIESAPAHEDSVFQNGNNWRCKDWSH